jgi:hypothetical protein
MPDSDNFFSRAVDRATKLRQSTVHAAANPYASRAPSSWLLISSLPVLGYGGVPGSDSGRRDFRACGLVVTPLPGEHGVALRLLKPKRYFCNSPDVPCTGLSVARPGPMRQGIAGDARTVAPARLDSIRAVVYNSPCQ